MRFIPSAALVLSLTLSSTAFAHAKLVSSTPAAEARASDVKTLTLPRALPVGTYAVTWHAVTADAHRIEGKYSFSVK